MVRVRVRVRVRFRVRVRVRKVFLCFTNTWLLPRSNILAEQTLPCNPDKDMASKLSSKTLGAKGYEVKVGDKISKFFVNHELDGDLPSQWIHGKVAGFKLAGKRGSKLTTTWWSLKFEPPYSNKLLCCNTEEVILMLHAAEEFRLKRHMLEVQLGKRLVLPWSTEDSDLSITDWDNDLRECLLEKYIASTQQFVLRFKCGYTKIVDGNEVVQLADASEAFYASTKAKTKRSIAKANKEWENTEENKGATRLVVAVDSSRKEEEVEDAIRSALAQRLVQKKAQEEALELKTQKQRDNVLRLEGQHAAASQLQAQELAAAALLQQQKDNAAAALLEQQQDETDAAAALLQQQQDAAAAEKQAQELAAAKQVEETEAAAALLQQQQEDATAQLQAQELAIAKLLEETEAAAALLQQKQIEVALLLQAKGEAAAKLLQDSEAAAALLQQQQDDAAAQLQAQELAAAKVLAETEAATALLQHQQDDAAAQLQAQVLAAAQSTCGRRGCNCTITTATTRWRSCAIAGPGTSCSQSTCGNRGYICTTTAATR